MSLLDTRDYYKPFDNPWMFDYYVLQNQMHWMPESVPLHTDVKDWQELDSKEKNLLTQIFRLFTQSDVDVGAGYVDRYMRIFRKPEAMGQIVTYSIRDESMHVEAMTKLFREFIQENLDIWTDDFKAELYEICRQMVTLEDKFLDLVFDMGDLEGLTKKDMYAYNRYIADRRLLQLGLKTNYDQRENPLGWLDEVMGVEHQNFFEGRATSYMKAGLRGRQDKITFANLESDNG
jgi:ribonucleotide reductase beta subunit family protein with ferritin-like domain